jgi:hypothetical protein
MTERHLEELDSARAGTLELVASLSQVQLDFSPGAGQWSIGEVLDHLLRSQHLYRDEISELVELKRAGRRPYLRRTFRELNLAPRFLPPAILPWLDLPLRVMNRLTPEAVRDVLLEFPILPARAADRGIPRKGRPAAELRAELLSSMIELRALIAANADLAFGELIWEHPLVGVADVPRLITLLARHECRHQRQIEGIRGNRKFSTTSSRQ